MSYKKYPSLTRDDHSKNIQWWLDRYPELETETYQITEKLDGANLQFNLSPHVEMQVGKRSSLIGRNSTFMNVWVTIDQKYTQVFDTLQDYVNDADVDMRLYGEIYGQGIQNRVWYGGEKQIRFFDIMINDVWLAPKDAVTLLNDLNLIDMYVPIIGSVDGIFEALQVKHDFMSYYDDVKPNNKPNYTEGIVIKPLNQVYESGSGSMFYIKRKNDLFKERTNTNKTPVVVSDNLLLLFNDFKTYININRVLSVFSKEGEIEQANQMGVYIRLVLEDAKKDFIDDNPDVDFDNMEKKDKKFIFNVGKYIVPILREYL